MNCKQCNNQIDENQLVCKKCGYQGPLMEERDKLNELREREKNLVHREVRKPLFLAFTIFLSISTVASLLPILGGDFGGILSAAFMLIATIGLWGSYLAKDNSALARALRNASFFDAYNKVIYTIYAVIDAFVFVIIAVVFFLLARSGDDSAAKMSDVLLVAGIMSVVSGLISVAVLLLIRYVFAKRRAYFLSFSKYAQTGGYQEKKLSPVGSYIIGGVNVFGGLSSLALSALATTITALIMTVLSQLADMGDGTGELLSVARAVVIAAFSGLAVGGVSKLALGLYYILSAVWMSSVHNAALLAHSEVDHQNVRRLDFERKSKEAYEEWQRENVELRVQSAELKIAEEATPEEAPVEEVANEQATPEEAPTEEAPVEHTASEEAPVEQKTTEE